ncbi:ATP-dependent DNA helicase RecG [Caldicellulosiruptor kronotskyensis 2002]|uniref:ATP-dependent DNA helicase RecG n=1 Tax=Caldicellulosiruptor kronotskyensis (strain DSM 18902 / VKM B-2412 / 2002) TaxID=632348 RepID=E4SC97_CALK2|nr:ATP-dependent DNA helicase RecG [Caldicellulosiruptor kronotskyensis]ADQ46332.1 ATP-dependent DNA helicase RecG [Caldicellulosiruptor kronotskyensis 2002]
MNVLEKDIRFLKGVGENREKLFKKLGIKKAEDLLWHIPRKYLDYSRLKKIRELCDGEIESFVAKVAGKPLEIETRSVKIIKIPVEDSTGVVTTVWFNQDYIKNVLKEGEVFCFSGKIERKGFYIEVKNPEFEKYDQHLIHTGRIVPVYNSTEGLSQKVIRNIVNNLLQQVDGMLIDIIPPYIRQKYNLSEINFAIKNIHFPENKLSLELARKRLVFEEFYLLQLSLLLLKENIEKNEGIKIENVQSSLKEFEKLLPFELTDAQKRVLAEIAQDLESTKQMNRLIQGDVGCGKTVVALASAYATIKAGYQVALMAPTEVLALQHYNECKKYFDNKFNVRLLIGSTPKKEKEIILKELEHGLCKMVIGTHALIQDDVKFKNLGLAITDEQHRFGVIQRVELTKKGSSPNILVMTATPIPRTLSLVLHGDLDISIIDQLPPGRKKILTYAVDESFRQRVYNFIKKQLDEGRQVYWICPLIEESETLNAKSAVEFAKSLKEGFFKDYNVACLHGKLSAKERDKILNDFKDGHIHILVSTTVVEVGINVPNATVMVIENAERFGLAQLHQLRGRVGRGEYQSYCILFNQSDSEIAKKRMIAITRSQNGFEIAEMDLKLRGPGDLFGTKQHGIMNFKVADIINDMDILKQARIAAEETIRLNLVDNKLLEKINKQFYNNIENIGL